MKLIAIVEGHGEVQAVPVLLRRVLHEQLQIYDIEVDPPIRIPKHKLLKKDGLERAIELAARRTSPTDGIIVLFDADDDCPAQLGPEVATRAKNCRPDRRVSVVIAKREFEAWFIAAADSLAGQRGFASDLVPPDDAEGIRDAKGWLSRHKPPGFPYRETIDQAALASQVNLEQAQRCRSFDKFMREVVTLVRLSF